MTNRTWAPWMAAVFTLGAGSALLAGTPVPQAPQTGGPPRLIVVLVSDQFRADYVTRYSKQWTKGLRRLLDQGAVFTEAAYPFFVTKTCAGHSTIGTGRFPASHGMIDNSWYDRATRRSRVCTDDPSATAVPFAGGAARERHGVSQMQGWTLADEVRRHTNDRSRVVTLSLKPRSAIGLAGRPGPGVMAIWKEDNGPWSTSTVYAQTPWPDVDDFVKAHPVADAFGTTWDRMLPVASYLNDDDGPGEGARAVFPYRLVGNNNIPDSTFQEAWEKSPLSNAYLGEMAKMLVERQALGQRDTTDFLGVSFSALDLVGHTTGPRSHEVQDVMVQLDVVIGDLLATLDRLVGKDRYVVAFSSDHGVPDLPEQITADGGEAGRIRTAAIRDAIETALDRLIDDATWIANITTPYIYFAVDRNERVETAAGGRDAVTRAILSVPGIERVVWPNEIRAADGRDPLLLALRRSYFDGRSGDVAFVIKRNWVPQATGTTHGSPYDYDQRVPLIIAGPGITAGSYKNAATPADIAPTLAHLAGVPMTQTDGRVLREALTRPPR
ncbi:MAG TPA: alkaline phosphatase family protein [Vicinamibacterales bacterium]|nr:alkaline phosphatase family protein [Vicinamibacterales bacterium]